MAVIAYIALGANLGEPLKSFSAAIEKLAHPELQVLARAKIYRSAPVGPSGQPDYFNSAVEVKTTLQPLALLEHVKAIEAALGRTTNIRWGARIIDLDILVYGGLKLGSERLTIPHRELANRPFALAPLADLAPNLSLPGLEATAQQLLAQPEHQNHGLELVEPHCLRLSESS